ncbi:hypothetical protein SteCoe_25158 [Stentor coeruleus]|uniref:Uncharacterized protein n=1 Tax=Stentor coeruleus TaxID=5963 RepID=A0A1R2BFW7_9CILI|nr:hypothetical protein SteCoe_25158 [Stentor coeruleus]
MYKKYKFFTPEPQGRHTKAQLLETMGPTISKFSRALYNRSFSPSQIDVLEKMNLRGDFTTNDDKSSTPRHHTISLKRKGRKFGFEGMQIMNLPRLPYGQHQNYKDCEFRKKHFIDMSSTPDAEELKVFNRQYRLQKKIDRKSRRFTKYSAEYTNNLKNFLIYPSDAGRLCCSREDEIMCSYEVEKKKYKFQATFQDFVSGIKSKSLSKRKVKIRETQNSLEDIKKILTREN